MASATGNPVRDGILYEVIRKIGGGVSFESAVAALAPDFDLDESEYTAAMKILNMAPGPQSDVPVRIEAGSEVPAPQSLPHPPQSIEAHPEPLTHQEAADAVLATDNALGEARMKLRDRQAETKLARSALATSITIWQTGLPHYSAERNVRDHLKAEQAARRQRIEQGGPAATAQPGKSYIDRAAKYGRDNTPEGAARSRMQNGARRGAFGFSQKFQKNFDPARGPVAKLPSER